MNATIKLDKHISKVIRWLQQAQIDKDDPRDVLKGIHVNENLAACDGYRLHVAKVNDENVSGMIVKQALKGHTVDLGTIRAGENLVEPTSIPGTYPEWEQILPQDNPAYEIVINPNHLIDALKGLDDSVRLRFYAPDKLFEVMGNIYTKSGSINETPVYALIMPNQGMDLKRWTPKDEEAQA